MTSECEAWRSLGLTLPVAGVRNHAQTARNFRRSLRNAAAGAQLIQVDGLDSKSAADVAAALADALGELHRLQRRLDRRIRRDQERRAGAVS
jgi:hypothetical protein